jgi:phage/plasmid-like protein (TIGR03299 family)
MAHELLIDDGQAAMFYVDERPWHGLGTRLTAPPSSREAIEAARLDWSVVKVPLYVVGGTRIHELPHRFAILREDEIGRKHCHVFGIAGREYTPLQNREAFEFFDPLVQDARATYETAGALGHGERVWIQARLAGDFEVVSGDAVQRFLLLSNSHDGTSSVQVKLTPIRVVCNNTLTSALAKGRTIRVRHDRDVRDRLEHAKELLGVIEAQYLEIAALFRRMAEVRFNQDRAAKYFADVFPERATADANRQSLENRRWALHFYEHGRGNEAPKVRHTLWAAYNGVTELIDHRRPANQAVDYSKKRLRSVWYGAGAATKERALRLAEQMTTAEDDRPRRSVFQRLFT